MSYSRKIVDKLLCERMRDELRKERWKAKDSYFNEFNVVQMLPKILFDRWVYLCCNQNR